MYDGCDDNILYFGKFAFEYAVMYKYMHSFFTAR